MNKRFKRIMGAICGATLTVGMITMSACGGDGATYSGFGSDYIVGHEEGKTVTYTLEAEYTNLGNKFGAGFSGEVSDVQMIERTSEASNGYCISGMNTPKMSVNFVIVSDREVDNAELTLTLGNVCNFSFSLSAEDLQIRVDPVSEADTYDYDAAESGAWGNWDADFLEVYKDGGYLPFAGYVLDSFDCGNIVVTATSADPSGFKDYTVTTKLHLYAGLNSISLITNNNREPQGTDNATMTAEAPVVDCIKIKTNAQLGMFKPLQNLSNLDLSKACTCK